MQNETSTSLGTSKYEHNTHTSSSNNSSTMTETETTATRRVSPTLPSPSPISSPGSSPSPSSASSTTSIQNANEKAADTNVGEVVSKSKRAASLLWMLLHAQKCPVPVNRNDDDESNLSHRTVLCCPHKGCREAKKLLLHTRACPAQNNVSSPCPTKYIGCQDSRKLLAHYRHCRDKAKEHRKQSRLTANKASPAKQQQINFCLICTLLAKHDMDVTEQMKMKKHNKKLLLSPSNFDSSNTPSLSPSSTSNGHSKTVQFDLNPSTSPPRGRSRTSSIESLLRNKIPAHSRPRSTSLDERCSLNTLAAVAYSLNDPTLEFELRRNKPKFVSSSTFDLPHMQSQSQPMSSSSGNNHTSTSGKIQAESIQFRKRSVSCSVMYKSCSDKRGCDTIMEE